MPRSYLIFCCSLALLGLGTCSDSIITTPALDAGVDLVQSCPCPTEFYCDLATSTCTAGCMQASDCSPGRICDTKLRQCKAGCGQDSDCVVAGQICDQARAQCRVGCRKSMDCAANQGCAVASSVCQPKCSLDSDCATGQICDPLESLCRTGCRKDPDCTGVGQICDSTSLLCQTQCTKDANCAAGQVCDPAKLFCRPGCRVDPDCASGQTCRVSDLTCQQSCTKDANCAAGQVCDTAQFLCKPAPGYPGCVGRQCQVQAHCPAYAGPTTVTGTVTIPAGTLPLYNVNIFIPSAAVPPSPTTGASCDHCTNAVPADAVTSATTDINGKFTLRNVPSGAGIPLVIRIGKWRRVVTIPSVVECTTAAIDPTLTRLPRNHTEGDIPKIAVSTGGADALECLLRSAKLGLDDAEFTNPTGTGRVNLYSGGVAGTPDSRGAVQYSAALGGAVFPTANPWWDSLTNWLAYDQVLLSCEGLQNPAAKSASAHQALLGYLNQGGRVVASHWHNIWISGGPAPLSSVAAFLTTGGYQNDVSPITVDINQTFPKGVALATWLNLHGGSATPGQIAVNHSRVTLSARTTELTQSWLDFKDPFGTTASQYFTFANPLGAPAAMQCGQMAFTDLHVSGGAAGGDTSLPTTPFPSGCVTTALSAQEKALLFALFDLGNCL